MRVRLLYENNIYDNSIIIDKRHQFQIIYLQFYQMTNIVNDKFNNIGILITNNYQDINLNIININSKTENI